MNDNNRKKYCTAFKWKTNWLELIGKRTTFFFVKKEYLNKYLLIKQKKTSNNKIPLENISSFLFEN